MKSFIIRGVVFQYQIETIETTEDFQVYAVNEEEAIEKTINVLKRITSKWQEVISVDAKIKYKIIE